MIDPRKDPLPRDINFDRPSLEWCWENINFLIEGRWPASRPSGYNELKVYVQRGILHASFETACLVAAEVRSRARKCGLDGYLVEDKYLNGQTEEEIARGRHLRLDDVYRRINKVLWYSASGPNQRYVCPDCNREAHTGKNTCRCGGRLLDLGYDDWKKRSGTSRKYRDSQPQPAKSYGNAT